MALRLPRRRTMRRCRGILFVLLAASACGKLDRLLEGPSPTAFRLSVGLDPTSVAIPQGGELVLTATLTRLGEYSGPAQLTIEGTPSGVTGTLENVTTAGPLTTATLKLHVSANAVLGRFTLVLRGHADGLNDATSLLILEVTEAPDYTVVLSSPSLIIARGGNARLSASITRANFTEPVVLSLTGVTGITAVFATNPVNDTSGTITVSVGANVPSGTYTLSILGKSASLLDRSATLSITVVADQIQLLAPAAVSVAQASQATTGIIVNRSPDVGPVTLSFDSLPDGVTASTQMNTPTSTDATMTFAVAATARPGTSRIVIRGRAAGVADATTTIQLTVTAAGIALSLDPDSVIVLQGKSSVATLAIARTNFVGPVAVTAELVPNGLTVSAEPTPPNGASTVVHLIAAETLAQGTYDVTLRATPVGLSSSAARAISMRVKVRPVPSGTGNVILDWSACAVPAWVAGQDGAEPWQELLPTGGAFRFSVTSGKGGFAYVESGNAVTVRYMTQAELTTVPVDMCPMPAGSKTVNGIGEHTALGQSWSYYMGGVTAMSTDASRNFSLVGVRNGPQDFLAWTPFGLSYRGVIRRELDIPNFGSLEPVSLYGSESFSAFPKVLTVTGPFIGGETLRHGMNYLTTAACTMSELYVTGAQPTTTTMYGVPVEQQVANDFHLLSLFGVSTSGTRTASVAFHTLLNRQLALPPTVEPPAVRSLAGTYRRLEATIASVPTVYNGTAELRYGDGTRAMTVRATVGYTGNSAVVLTMPDFRSVSGWSNAFALLPDAAGTWTTTLDGASSSESVCTENRTMVKVTRTGVY